MILCMQLMHIIISHHLFRNMLQVRLSMFLSLWKAHSQPLQYQAVNDRCKTTVDYETGSDQALIDVNPVNFHRICCRVAHSHSGLLIPGWCRHSQRLYCKIPGDSYTFCFQTLA